MSFQNISCLHHSLALWKCVLKTHCVLGSGTLRCMGHTCPKLKFIHIRLF